MKKIKTFMFIVVAMLVSFFVMSNNEVKADGLSADIDVVFNPNENGEGLNIHNGIQYSASRNIDIGIYIDEEEFSKLEDYDESFKVCETIPASSIDNTRAEERCSIYETTVGINRFQLSGRGDGEKKLTIYFYQRGHFDSVSSLYIKNKIEKTITLDTTGPIINLTGGEYMYLLRSEKYEELGATCTDDSGVINGTCQVEIGEAVIDKNKEGFQYIRYTAEDFLGNEVVVTRKIVVEQLKEKKDYSYWIYAGVGVAILAGFLFVKVLKNKDKQKNQSVL